MRGFLRRCAGLMLVVTLCGVVARGQTLAHKGWAGSGITIEPWWEGAVLYQIDPVSFQDSKGDGFGDLRGIIQRLDYLKSLSVDAIVLSPFELQAEFGKGGSGPPFDAKYGTEEDLDHLVQQASRDRIRVFVDLPLGPSHTTQEVGNIARFWLSRGIAGLRLTQEQQGVGALTAAQLAERLKELRRLVGTFAGQRVLFWALPQPIPAGSQDAAQMVLDGRLAALTRFTTVDLRDALQPAATRAGVTAPTAVPMSDGGGIARSFDRFGDEAHDPQIAKLLAAALMTSRGAPMLYFGQEVGMATTPEVAAGGKPKPVDPTPMQWGDAAGFTSGVPWVDMGRNAITANVALEDADAESLLNWYRRLSELHHQSAALRTGTMDMVAETNPDIVAWVRRPRAAGTITEAPVLVVCNVTGRPLLVTVSADVRRAGVVTESSMMHTLLSTTLAASGAGVGGAAPITGPVSMNSISLPPYGVYIGQLAKPPGWDSSRRVTR